ncbi:MAG: hypothetical protein P8I27_15150 [Pirellulaceae bacterium]|nr:hypothetical protein [Pirellulaceae bacterium]
MLDLEKISQASNDDYFLSEIQSQTPNLLAIFDGQCQSKKKAPRQEERGAFDF